jgi:hypothetical protein
MTDRRFRKGDLGPQWTGNGLAEVDHLSIPIS